MALFSRLPAELKLKVLESVTEPKDLVALTHAWPEGLDHIHNKKAGKAVTQVSVSYISNCVTELAGHHVEVIPMAIKVLKLQRLRKNNPDIANKDVMEPLVRRVLSDNDNEKSQISLSLWLAIWDLLVDYIPFFQRLVLQPYKVPATACRLLRHDNLTSPCTHTPSLSCRDFIRQHRIGQGFTLNFKTVLHFDLHCLANNFDDFMLIEAGLTWNSPLNGQKTWELRSLDAVCLMLALQYTSVGSRSFRGLISYGVLNVLKAEAYGNGGDAHGIPEEVWKQNDDRLTRGDFMSTPHNTPYRH
ncbi:hypothetical protein SUNI508_04939 [Seiridium unicorne]|uniref:F-box domain-containing protein n=1 Tax=Seiridium unicorne TaxID=138068 RepID=A0ABR2V5T7_9PEZI